MFKKKQKEKLVNADCVNKMINASIELKEHLINIEQMIKKLKAEQDACEFDRLLNEIEDVEYILEQFNNDQELNSIRISYKVKAESLLMQYKHDVQLILYGAKWHNEG